MTQEPYRALTMAPKPGRPLVFAFHGTGGDETQFFKLAEALVPGGGVISPRGDVSESGAARFFRRTGEGVYDMNDLARATDKMARFIAEHRAAYPESPGFGFGYSNGANLLASVVMQHPELLDRTALLHPLVTWDTPRNAGLNGRRVLITAGRRDPITPWPKSAALIDWFEASGAKVSTEVHEGGHDLRSSEVLALQTFFAD
ncbi:MAG: alpha/beta hydrolase [Pseudomonadota bacterium]